MRQKSIFPALFLLFGAMMAVSHFSHLLGPEKAPVKVYKKGAVEIVSQTEELKFRKYTDTSLSDGFRMVSSIHRSGEDPGLVTPYSSKMIVVAGKPVFDTILNCWYRNEQLLKETSLKTLVAERDPDAGFWTRAGLEEFDVDMMNSGDEVLACNFTFRNHRLEKSRKFILYVNRKGGTRIKEI